MKYENLSRLLTLIETDTTSMGMFEADVKFAGNVILPLKDEYFNAFYNRNPKSKSYKSKREPLEQIASIVLIELTLFSQLLEEKCFIWL